MKLSIHDPTNSVNRAKLGSGARAARYPVSCEGFRLLQTKRARPKSNGNNSHTKNKTQRPDKAEGARSVSDSTGTELQKSRAEGKHKIRGSSSCLLVFAPAVDDDLALNRGAFVVVNVNFAERPPKCWQA